MTDRDCCRPCPLPTRLPVVETVMPDIISGPFRAGIGGGPPAFQRSSRLGTAAEMPGANTRRLGPDSDRLSSGRRNSNCRCPSSFPLCLDSRRSPFSRTERDQSDSQHRLLRLERQPSSRDRSRHPLPGSSSENNSPGDNGEIGNALSGEGGPTGAGECFAGGGARFTGSRSFSTPPIPAGPSIIGK